MTEQIETVSEEKPAVPVPEVKTEENTDDEDLAFAYAEYDRFSFIAAKVMKFRDKTIEEWMHEIAIPEVDSTMNLDEMGQLNLFAINLIEKVNRNYGYAKSAFDMATIKYSTAFQKEKIRILEELRKTKSKASADSIETAVQHNIKDIYLAHKVAELFYEFWKSVQAKVKSFDGRLTSISMISQMERRNVKYEG